MTDTASGRATSASRRGFLHAAGGAATLGSAGVARGQEVAQTFRFDCEVAGWHATAPAGIEGTTNPPLNLEAGQTYEFVWTNLDGAPHNFTIWDEQQNVLAQTDTTSEEGATLSLTVTAEEAMSTYVCTIHPNTMIGDILFGQQAGAQGPGTPFGLPWALLMLGGFVVVAVLSPIAFAVLLWREYVPRGEGPADRT